MFRILPFSLNIFSSVTFVTFQGDVANEVETEQLVYDAHVSSVHLGRFTSFVQVCLCHTVQNGDISSLSIVMELLKLVFFI